MKSKGKSLLSSSSSFRSVNYRSISFRGIRVRTASTFGRLRKQRPVMANCCFAMVCLFTALFFVVHLPTFVREVHHVMNGITENVYDVVEMIDGCRSVGMGQVKSTRGREVVQGEGQSWNHFEKSSGSACAYRLTRQEQLSHLDVDALPRIFVYEPRVNQRAYEHVKCEEQFFTEVMRANITGTLVDTVEAADRIYVAFYAQCFPNQKMRLEEELRDGKDDKGSSSSRKSTRSGKWRKSMSTFSSKKSPFDLLWEELQGEDEIMRRIEDVFIFSERHWTKRTGFGLEIRQVLKNYPFTILSPEVTNLQEIEVYPKKSGKSGKGGKGKRDSTEWLGRHVVMPQPPLVAWPLADAEEEYARPYKFCFSGTQINKERRVLSRLLSERNDSYVVAGCRRDRHNLQHHLRNNKFSATQQYRSCEMCLVPHGDSLSDRRLFDAMSSGCVPVITPKLRPLPYAMSEEVDYTQATLTLKYKTESDLKQKLDELAGLPGDRLASYRKASVSIANKLSYSECGDYSGLFLTLNQLRLQREMQALDQLPSDLHSILLQEQTQAQA